MDRYRPMQPAKPLQFLYPAAMSTKKLTLFFTAVVIISVIIAVPLVVIQKSRANESLAHKMLTEHGSSGSKESIANIPATTNQNFFSQTDEPKRVPESQTQSLTTHQDTLNIGTFGEAITSATQRSIAADTEKGMLTEGSATEKLSSATERADSALSSATERADSALSSATERADSALSSATERADSALSSATERADSALSYATERADSTLTSATERVDSALSSATERSDSALSSATERAGSALSSATEPADSALSSATERAGSALSSATEPADSALSSATERADSALSSATERADSASSSADLSAPPDNVATDPVTMNPFTFESVSKNTDGGQASLNADVTPVKSSVSKDITAEPATLSDNVIATKPSVSGGTDAPWIEPSSKLTTLEAEVTTSQLEIETDSGSGITRDIPLASDAATADDTTNMPSAIGASEPTEINVPASEGTFTAGATQ
ncbi:nuclear pore complex protein DDB_G0274915-like [Ornithodoros turicata]|uniref:nuclear pore complex protein DDB_G0274915-like n=1 Tax=Ornithodoros turicata TaxID=34597 RepID=UPI0031397AF5